MSIIDTTHLSEYIPYKINTTHSQKKRRSHSTFTLTHYFKTVQNQTCDLCIDAKKRNEQWYMYDNQNWNNPEMFG
jgi:hypothetical protein